MSTTDRLVYRVPECESPPAIDCPHCQGKGLVASESGVYDCPRCGGWGWVYHDDAIGCGNG